MGEEGQGGLVATHRHWTANGYIGLATKLSSGYMWGIVLWFDSLFICLDISFGTLKNFKCGTGYSYKLQLIIIISLRVKMQNFGNPFSALSFQLY